LCRCSCCHLGDSCKRKERVDIDTHDDGVDWFLQRLEKVKLESRYEREVVVVVTVDDVDADDFLVLNKSVTSSYILQFYFQVTTYLDHDIPISKRSGTFLCLERGS
jgi:hypothetical protein